MPSTRQELEATRTARWYRHASGARRAGAWSERVRDYAALRSILDGHAAGGTAASAAERKARRREQPPLQLPGLLKLVAEHGHYAGAEPVYRRYRHSQQGQQILRLAGPDPAVRPTAAFLGEARVVTFWPYREGVIEVADAFDMSRAEWAAAYLRALAAWAAEDRPLAAYRPAGPPACVLEDMTAIAGGCTRWAGSPATAGHGERLSVLADEVVQSVLNDVSITPLGALNTVRHEVRSLLSPPSEPVADVLRSAAELSDRILHPGDGDVVITQEQARRLRSMIGGLSALLEEVSG
ncbi:hypothetical protein EAS64_16080 [Trebonia kvetii]|uniref:Uncharacterized protein n=1 Tax=Trebonia kvetii TaxID=2480626 RepID=A0A6P2BXS7_9ACTN|nr:hypothetical protein [Trebonia kvetii]TVZ03949.1 hypothetical protein EAS64_16080 [Trebonia kvetii]